MDQSEYLTDCRYRLQYPDIALFGLKKNNCRLKPRVAARIKSNGGCHVSLFP